MKYNKKLTAVQKGSAKVVKKRSVSQDATSSTKASTSKAVLKKGEKNGSEKGKKAVPRSLSVGHPVLSPATKNVVMSEKRKASPSPIGSMLRTGTSGRSNSQSPGRFAGTHKGRQSRLDKAKEILSERVAQSRSSSTESSQSLKPRANSQDVKRKSSLTCSLLSGSPPVTSGRRGRPLGSVRKQNNSPKSPIKLIRRALTSSSLESPRNENTDLSATETEEEPDDKIVDSQGDDMLKPARGRGRGRWFNRVGRGRKRTGVHSPKNLQGNSVEPDPDGLTSDRGEEDAIEVNKDNSGYKQVRRGSVKVEPNKVDENEEELEKEEKTIDTGDVYTEIKSPRPRGRPRKFPALVDSVIDSAKMSDSSPELNLKSRRISARGQRNSLVDERENVGEEVKHEPEIEEEVKPVEIVKRPRGRPRKAVDESKESSCSVDKSLASADHIESQDVNDESARVGNKLPEAKADVDVMSEGFPLKMSRRFSARDSGDNDSDTDSSKRLGQKLKRTNQSDVESDEKFEVDARSSRSDVITSRRSSSASSIVKSGVEEPMDTDLDGDIDVKPDNISEAKDLDSSGSSQSLIDIFKQTIALRQQLAKERQKWQKPDDELSTTSSSEERKNVFEVFANVDLCAESEITSSMDDKIPLADIAKESTSQSASEDIISPRPLGRPKCVFGAGLSAEADKKETDSTKLTDNHQLGTESVNEPTAMEGNPAGIAPAKELVTMDSQGVDIQQGDVTEKLPLSNNSEQVKSEQNAHVGETALLGSPSVTEISIATDVNVTQSVVDSENLNLTCVEKSRGIVSNIAQNTDSHGTASVCDSVVNCSSQAKENKTQNENESQISESFVLNEKILIEEKSSLDMNAQDDVRNTKHVDHSISASDQVTGVAQETAKGDLVGADMGKVCSIDAGDSMIDKGLDVQSKILGGHDAEAKNDGGRCENQQSGAKSQKYTEKSDEFISKSESCIATVDKGMDIKSVEIVKKITELLEISGNDVKPNEVVCGVNQGKTAVVIFPTASVSEEISPTKITNQEAFAPELENEDEDIKTSALSNVECGEKPTIEGEAGIIDREVKLSGDKSIENASVSTKSDEFKSTLAVLKEEMKPEVKTEENVAISGVDYDKALLPEVETDKNSASEIVGESVQKMHIEPYLPEPIALEDAPDGSKADTESVEEAGVTPHVSLIDETSSNSLLIADETVSTDNKESLTSPDSAGKDSANKKIKLKRRSELDLLNDVDGSISRRKKIRVYQQAYELYGDKGLMDNALAKTLLGLGKFDAENMSRSKLVEELANKGDANTKVMTRGKQNRFSHLFKKKKRDSRPASPAGSQSAAHSPVITPQPDLTKTVEEFTVEHIVGEEVSTELIHQGQPGGKIKTKPAKTPRRHLKNAVPTTSPRREKKLKEPDLVQLQVDYSTLSGSIEYMVRYCKPCSIQLIDIIKCLDALQEKTNDPAAVVSGSGANMSMDNTQETSENTATTPDEKSRKRKASASPPVNSTAVAEKTEESPTKKNVNSPTSMYEEHFLNFIQDPSSCPSLKIKNVAKKSPSRPFIVDNQPKAVSEPGTTVTTVTTPVEQPITTDDTSLRRSMRATTRTLYRCLFCKYTCHIRKIMEDHVYNHMDIIPYMCGLCYAIFGTRGGVLVHNRRSHPGHQPVIIKKSEVDETQYYTTLDDFLEKYGDVASALPAPYDNKPCALNVQQSLAKKAYKSPKTTQSNVQTVQSSPSQISTTSTTSSAQPKSILPKGAIPVILATQNPSAMSKASNAGSQPQFLLQLSPSMSVGSTSASQMSPQMIAVSGVTSPQLLLRFPVVASSVSGAMMQKSSLITTAMSVTPAIVSTTTSVSVVMTPSTQLSDPDQVNKAMTIDTSVAETIPQKRSPIILRIPKYHQWQKESSESSDEGSTGEEPKNLEDCTIDENNDASRVDEDVIEGDMEHVQNEDMAGDYEDEADSPKLMIVNVCSLAGNIEAMDSSEMADEAQTSQASAAVSTEPPVAPKAPIMEKETDKKTAMSMLEDLNTSLAKSCPDGKLKPEEVWQCLSCKENTRLYDVMVEHIHTVHKKTYWYACPYCPFGCSQPRFNMYRHMRRTHPQKDDNIFVGIIDGDRYFVKKTVGLKVMGSLENNEPTLVADLSDLLPSMLSTSPARDKTGSDVDRSRSKEEEEGIFPRSDSAKRAVKPTAHVAPAVQNKTPVQEEVWSDSTRGVTVPVYIAEENQGQEIETCQEILNTENSCVDSLTVSEPVGSSSTTAVSPNAAADHSSTICSTQNNTCSAEVNANLATQSLSLQKTSSAVPMGIVEGSTTNKRKDIQPLNRASTNEVSSTSVLPRPAHQGSPHIVPANAYSRANIQRPIHSTPPMRSATVHPTVPSSKPSTSDEDEARRAFSVFNISARMRTPSLRPPPPLQQPQPTISNVVMQPQPAHQRNPTPRPPPAASLDQFKQFQLPPRLRNPASSFTARVQPPPYGMSPVHHQGMPMGHHVILQSMPPRMTPAPKRLPQQITPAMARTTAPQLTQRPVIRTTFTHWTCPYCPVPNMMSKPLVEKHIRNCHPDQKVVYVPYTN